MGIPIWFGTKTKKDLITSGMFFCPTCKGEKSYELIHAEKHAHVYGLSMIRLKDFGYVVLCKNCESGFYPDILLPENQMKLILKNKMEAIKRKLKIGYSFTDIIDSDMGFTENKYLTLQILHAIVGENMKFCQECQNSYSLAPSFCPCCGHELETVEWSERNEVN